MGRPMVRTETLDAMQLELMRGIFGNFNNCWTNLMAYLVPRRVSFWTLQRVFQSKGVDLHSIRAIDEALDEWIEEVKKTVRKRRAELAEGEVR